MNNQEKTNLLTFLLMRMQKQSSKRFQFQTFENDLVLLSQIFS